MNSDNQKFSMRQIYRLFLFDFLGISTLVLPSFLSGAAGVYGGISILAAGFFGALYLCYLVWGRGKIGTDLVTFLSDSSRAAVIKKVMGALLVLTHIASAGFTAALLAGMVKQSLIREENYALILFLALLVCAYIAGGSFPARAKVYEILFWFVVAPLVLMLVVAAKEIDLEFYMTQRAAAPAAVAGSAYQVFVCFGALFSVLLLPQTKENSGVKNLENKKFGRCVGLALLTAIVLLLAAYYLMLGVFGEAALASLRYPVVTLMSMIQFKGGFFKRMDAIMLGIWFFALSALLTMNLYYGGRLLCQIARSGKKVQNTENAETRRIAVCRVCVLALTFLAGLLIGYGEDAWVFFVNFFRYFQMPLYLLVPGVCVLVAKIKKE
jgi:hypothetical protein